MNSIFFLGGQFAPDGGGQFESDCIGQPNHLRGGQFDRCLHSYIDSFLDRGVNAYQFAEQLKWALEGNNESWYLN